MLFHDIIVDLFLNVDETILSYRVDDIDRLLLIEPSGLEVLVLDGIVDHLDI